jgi:hypothetical protein
MLLSDETETEMYLGAQHFDNRLSFNKNDLSKPE